MIKPVSSVKFLQSLKSRIKRNRPVKELTRKVVNIENSDLKGISKFSIKIDRGAELKLPPGMLAGLNS